MVAPTCLFGWRIIATETQAKALDGGQIWIPGRARDETIPVPSASGAVEEFAYRANDVRTLLFVYEFPRAPEHLLHPKLAL